MIGRIIDKYQILEEVGQGGMSVVYKGLDMSLNREVAVKVLHRHLASQEEARQRFQREAHAVAKLRHENILEIFDYSGRESAESWIVTEFIRGRTLRGFIAEHALAFPEIAAMLTVEVCRALAHAHSLGVLHRDVKPENIMIRDDGVLKLTDFGIAQIVDSQRMTVTGQLLGSPAYMSPEHVEGRPLDFRTDVFSTGILLYQLSTSELPFKGRNPHEILKRIAECKFLDARVVNPLVSDRLNRIIMKALARNPDDRYPTVGPLLDDLLRFLSEVELGDPRTELRNYFAKPVSYEQALRQRLIAALTKRGRVEFESKHTAVALELWNRVLTIDPANEDVLGLIDRLSRRQRVRWGAAAAACALGTAAGLLGLARARPEEPLPVAIPHMAVLPRAAQPPVLPPPTAPRDAGVVASAVHRLPDAAPHVGANLPSPRPTAPERHPLPPVEPRPPTPGALRTFRFSPFPKSAKYSVDSGSWVQVENGVVLLALGPGSHTVVFRNPVCEDAVTTIGANDPAPSRSMVVTMPFKPTKIRPKCPRASTITVNGRIVDSMTWLDIHSADFDMQAQARVEIDFVVDGAPQHKVVKVTAGDDPRDVTCD